jgi:hypothetical protein
MQMDQPLVLGDLFGRQLSSTTNIILHPTDEEWGDWSAARLGQRIAFRTQLDTFFEKGPKSPATSFETSKPDGSGKFNLALVATKGARLLRIASE